MNYMETASKEGGNNAVNLERIAQEGSRIYESIKNTYESEYIKEVFSHRSWFGRRVFGVFK